MSQPKKILVIGRHPDMLEKVVGMLNQQGYDATGQTTNEGAMLAFQADTIDAVIIGGGVDQESRLLFRSEFPKLNPGVHIIDAHPQTVLSELKAAFQG